jgi:hypothetical protein
MKKLLILSVFTFGLGAFASSFAQSTTTGLEIPATMKLPASDSCQFKLSFKVVHQVEAPVDCFTGVKEWEEDVRLDVKESKKPETLLRWKSQSIEGYPRRVTDRKSIKIQKT